MILRVLSGNEGEFRIDSETGVLPTKYKGFYTRIYPAYRPRRTARQMRGNSMDKECKCSEVLFRKRKESEKGNSPHGEQKN